MLECSVLLCLMVVCSWLMVCSGCEWVLIIVCLLMVSYSVVMLLVLNEKLKVMLLMIVNSVFLLCLMWVECDFLCSVLKKLLLRLVWVCI